MPDGQQHRLNLPSELWYFPIALELCRPRKLILQGLSQPDRYIAVPPCNLSITLVCVWGGGRLANRKEYKSNRKEEKRFNAKFMRQETGQGERRTHLAQRKEFRKKEKNQL